MKSKTKQPAQKPNPDPFFALMAQWPESWAGLEEDKEPGGRLLVEFRPFIMHITEIGLSTKTVRRHLDNLWVIGGEVIRRFNFEPELRRESARQLLLDAVETGEAPMLSHATEAEQLSADATARKLLRFLLGTA